jgi:hypothetical protein
VLLGNDHSERWERWTGRTPGGTRFAPSCERRLSASPPRLASGPQQLSPRFPLDRYALVTGHRRTAAWCGAPVHSDWAHLAGCGPERVAELRTGHPFSVLLATGMGLDALDLPAQLGGPPRSDCESPAFRSPSPPRRPAGGCFQYSGVARCFVN